MRTQRCVGAIMAAERRPNGIGIRGGNISFAQADENGRPDRSTLHAGNDVNNQVDKVSRSSGEELWNIQAIAFRFHCP